MPLEVTPELRLLSALTALHRLWRFVSLPSEDAFSEEPEMYSITELGLPAHRRELRGNPTHVNPSQIVLPFPYVADPHHPALVVLDIALQAAISALHQAHPSLDHDHEPPYDFNATTDEILAQIVVVSSIALLDLLRHYRAVQDQEANF